MFNKDYFILKENDWDLIVENLNVYKNAIEDLIKNAPSLTVTEYIDHVHNKTKQYDGIMEKYYLHYYVNTSDKITDLIQKMDELENEIITPLYQRKDFFEFSKTLKAETVGEKTFKEKMLKGFIKNGLNLSEEGKKEFIKISNELSELSIKFNKNISESQKQIKCDLTEDLKLVITEKDLSFFEDGVLVYNENKIMDILQESTSPEFRKIAYLMLQKVAKDDFDNAIVIQSIVEKKQKIANMLDYKNYAIYALENRMAKTPSNVTDFLKSMSKVILPQAKKERKKYETFVKKEYGINDIKNSDEAYYGNLYREKMLSFEKDEERKYLPYDEAVKASFELVKNLLNISFEKVDFFELPYEDMETYKVYNDGVFKGYMILDLYYREIVKHQGAWVSSVTSPSKSEEGIVSLCCNFDKTKEGMSIDDLTTLLHELGHLTHYFSTQTEFESHSGTGGMAHDAVEIPSQVLEKYSLDKEFLNSIVKTTSFEEIPNEIYEKLLKLSRFNMASFYARQISFGLFDMSIYTGNYKESIHDLYMNISEKYTTKKADVNTNFPNTFSHIFDGGYSAGYYGYMWADVYSIDAFVHINENRKEHALSYKEKFLSKGGSEESIKIYEDFRGSLANPNSFLTFYDLA